MSDQNSKCDTLPATLEGPRPACLEEREELIAMINTIFRIAVGRPPTIGSDWAHVYAPENLANVAVICDVSGSEVSGKLVASTGVWVCDVEIGAVRLRVGGINCVGTLPDYRRLGLGSQVMAAAHDTLREQGCHVAILSTGISNWYRAMGWVEAGKTRTYRLNRANIGLLPQVNELRVVIKRLSPQPTENSSNKQNSLLAPDFAAITEEVVQLHNQQRMGARRTLDSFRQLARARRVDRIALLLPADHAGDESRAIAYLLMRENVVIEWAGEAAEVLALVRATFEALDDPDISTTLRQSDQGQSDQGRLLLRRLLLQTPGWQQPISDYLDGVGIPYDGNFLGMLYVVDPQALAAAYGLAELDISIVEVDGTGERVGEKRFVVTHQQESLEVDRRQLTKLLFGPERISPLAAAHLPLRFWQWELEMV